MTDIAVVILNWNGKGYLEKFLPFVVKHSSFRDTEVIVADNGSTDDSIAFILKHFPTVRVITLGKNYGFAWGYHKALEEIHSKYYVLLNSDVEVTPDWLIPLFNMMELHPKMGACMPKIVSYHHRDQFEYAGASGGYIDRFGYPFCRGRILSQIEKDHGQYDAFSEIFWASGACMFVRATAYEYAGGLDEAFFAHMEEIDLCWRMHRTGWKVSVVPASKIYHVGGGTLPNNNPSKLYLNYRNSLFMLIKNLPVFQLIPVVLIRMILDGFSAILYLIQGNPGFFFAVIRAHLAFQRRIPGLIKKRRELKGTIRTGKFKEIYPRSIVFDFFVCRKRKFDQLSW